jgi:AcrR family transcriptional regulator
VSVESKPRKYRKRLRAESEAETRQRITEAAMRLHGSVGPARTTIKGIADEAGVQRATVYRHFPSEEAIFAACSAHWYSLNPPPDLSRWEAVDDPDARLELALRQTYEWFEWAEPMLTNIFRDRELVPALRSGPAPDAMAARGAAGLAALMKGRGLRGHARRRVQAAIAHATAFPTWRSLTRENGLAAEEAVELMTATVAAAAGGRGR